MQKGLINLPDFWEVGLFAIRIGIFLLLFVLVEKKKAYPVFAIHLFSGNRVFTRGNANIFTDRYNPLATR